MPEVVIQIGSAEDDTPVSRAGESGPPGAAHFELAPPQPLRLQPPASLVKTPSEGQSGRMMVEGTFTRVSKDELIFSVERIYDTEFNVEAAYAEIAGGGDE